MIISRCYLTFYATSGLNIKSQVLNLKTLQIFSPLKISVTSPHKLLLPKDMPKDNTFLAVWLVFFADMISGNVPRFNYIQDPPCRAGSLIRET